MRLSRRIILQLAIFAVVAVVAGAVMLIGYIKVPALLGVGRYTVNVELPRSGGLYKNGNVTYRGTEVGRITNVHLTATGVEAVLSLRSDIPIPSDLQARVHSVSGFGEQYVALHPLNDNAAPLKNGDVIPMERTTVPPDINSLLDAADRGLQAIPPDNVQTVIDESYTAVGGLGPDLSRLVKGSTRLAIDARANLGPLTTLIDQSKPVLDSQADTAAAIQGWAAHLAEITGQLRDQDPAVADLFDKGATAAEEGRQLFQRLQPTLPLLLANLVSIDQVGITYQPALEQLLVLVPEATAMQQATQLANRNTGHLGAYMDFNLNLNLPPPCTTGYLPPQQQRAPTFEDVPDRPAGELYCRIPQDSSLAAVRGARNYPCITGPGKRAATVKMCESDEQYVPLNDGTNWKGDPNATLSGQGVPELPPPVPPQAPPPQVPPAPPLAAAEYNPSTGTYVGPDGRVYTQSDLAHSAEGKTWQNLVLPPPTN
jgi:phospholipid/cholesterol/gamma-HCH transport system substrate-binding protein